MSAARIELPPKLLPVFDGQARYRGAFGGRGSAKTRSFALMTAVRGYALARSGQSGVILCGREFQNSLEDSSMEEVKQAIRSVPWLADYYDVGERYIRTGDGRVSYVFSGLRHNLDSLKSKARILLAWIDEAENVSETAWVKLGPTVREADSEIWVTWNPELDGSPTDRRFRKTPADGTRVVELNYTDNPWFPATLEAERLADLNRLDASAYQWVWEGAYRKNSKAQILANKVRVAEFVPSSSWEGPYHGLDFGFAQDPTAAVKCWVHDGRLMVEYEAGKVGLEIDQTAQHLRERIPDIDRYMIRADSARPETISHLQRHGLPRCVGVDKWQGSVEDGIAHMRGYSEIVVHPRCKETIRETRLWSYKVDRLTGDVLPDVVDANNHWMDAIRYALAPMIKRRPTGARTMNAIV